MLSKVQQKALSNITKIRLSKLLLPSYHLTTLTNCTFKCIEYTEPQINNHNNYSLIRLFSSSIKPTKNYVNSLKSELSNNLASSVYPKVRIDEKTHYAIKQQLTLLYHKEKDTIFTTSFDLFKNPNPQMLNKEQYDWTLECILAVYKLVTNLQNANCTKIVIKKF